MPFRSPQFAAFVAGLLAIAASLPSEAANRWEKRMFNAAEKQNIAELLKIAETQDVDINVCQKTKHADCAARPLTYVVALGSVNQVRKMLELGADPLAETYGGSTPVMSMCCNVPDLPGKFELLFGETGIPVDTPAGISSMVEGLIPEGAHPMTLASFAAAKPYNQPGAFNDEALLRLLVQEGADLEAPVLGPEPETVFLAILKRGSPALVDLTFAENDTARAAMNAVIPPDPSKIEMYERMGHRMAMLAQRTGKPVDPMWRKPMSTTPLIELIRKGNLTAVDRLIAEGAEVEQPTPEGLTALSAAQEAGNPLLVDRIETELQRRRIASMIDRDQALPPQVRHDKYMIALTDHLKNQRYAEALPYFGALARLDIPLDPAFEYFYGEALLRTGQPEDALTHLYNYVSQQGSGAPHYRDALALINEAELGG